MILSHSFHLPPLSKNTISKNKNLKSGLNNVQTAFLEERTRIKAKKRKLYNGIEDNFVFLCKFLFHTKAPSVLWNFLSPSAACQPTSETYVLILSH